MLISVKDLSFHVRLNESPSKKEGKSSASRHRLSSFHASMKAPPRRKGNTETPMQPPDILKASMKAPPRRKGNHSEATRAVLISSLNESPSKKEGKWLCGLERGRP